MSMLPYHLQAPVLWQAQNFPSPFDDTHSRTRLASAHQNHARLSWPALVHFRRPRAQPCRSRTLVFHDVGRNNLQCPTVRLADQTSARPSSHSAAIGFSSIRQFDRKDAIQIKVGLTYILE